MVTKWQVIAIFIFLIRVDTWTFCIEMVNLGLEQQILL